MPPGTVDMNVHPTKAEVRFRDPAAVESLIEEAVRESLTSDASAATLDTQLAPPQLLVREPRPPRAVEESEAESQTALFLSANAGGADATVADATANAAPHREGHEGDDAVESIPVVEERPRLWQVLNTYVLAETHEGLIIIDQHSAHERVLFERLSRAFEESGQIGQRLLFPLTIRLSKAEYEQVEALTGILDRVGFALEGFGGNTIIVHAVPDPHPYFDPERCLREMIDDLVSGSDLTRSAKNQHEKIAMTFACKGAIKAGQVLSESEMQELFDQLFATELPYHDVHGRPTIVRLSKSELERKFGR